MKPYLIGNAADMQRVGANDGDYEGPCARISFDKDWLHITTDDYEGHAMINIEALSKLRQALARIDHEIKKRRAALETQEKPA